jgi:predicted permease
MPDAAGPALEALFAELRHATRALLRQPIVSLVAVVTIAVGSSALAAVLSLHHAMLQRPLQVAAPEDLRLIDERRSGMTSQPVGVDAVPYARFEAYQAALADVFVGMAADRYATFSLSSGGDAASVGGYLVSGNYFEVLGLPPRAGRYFAHDEEPSVVLGEDVWVRRFGGDPDIIGRTVRIDSRAYTVAAVAPRTFRGTIHGLAADVWIPIGAYEPGGGWHETWVTFFGRLRPGVEDATVEAAVDGAALAIPPLQSHTVVRGADVAHLTGLPPAVRPTLGRFFTLILAMGALVLLIAASNIAGMLMARAEALRQEVAVRLALGAGRVRVVRRFLVETLLLFAVGGAGGVLLGDLLTRVIEGVRPPVGLDVAFDLSPSPAVLGLALLITLVIGGLFGIVPALVATRGDLTVALKAMARGQARRARAWPLFVGAQLALAVLLLVGAGLLARSAFQGLATDIGFDPEGVVVARVNLGPHGYTEEQATRLFTDLVRDVRTRPGVEAAALADNVLLGAAYGRNTSDVQAVDGAPGAESSFNSAFSVVRPGYFETLGIELVGGRLFSPGDDSSGPLVVVVNETLARRFWPAGNPVGNRLRQDGREYEVVGVVRDGKYQYVTEGPSPYVFRAELQDPRRALTLHVRASSAPAVTLGSVQDALRRLDPDVALQGGEALDDLVEVTLFPQRFAAAAVGSFGLVGLVFATVGVYGLLSFRLARRTHEIGIRVALGGAPRRLVRDMVLDAGRVTLGGVASGLLLAALLGRFLQALMIGITPLDPITYAGVAVSMLAVATLASFVPARRATAVDPVEALRAE